MRAVEQLKDEHKGVKLMLRVTESISARLAEGGAVPVEHLEQTLEFFQIFADRCHHGKEEDFLFPALERHGIAREGGPIGVMLAEHDMGRAFLRGMRDAVEGIRSGHGKSIAAFGESARGYIELLGRHIEKEENVLFAMAERVLSAEEDDVLFEAFENLELERIGAGKHEEFHSLMGIMKGIYLS